MRLILPCLMLSACWQYDSDSEQFELGEATTIEITARGTSVSIFGLDREDLSVIKTLSASPGVKIGETILVSGELVGDTFVVDIDGTEVPQDVRPSAVLHLPVDLEVVLDDGGGDIYVADVKALEILDITGSVYASGIPGGVVIVDSGGTIDLTDVGPVQIEDTSGNITVTMASGPVQISDTTGDLYVSEATAGGTIDDTEGLLEMARCAGDWTLTHGEGRIVINNTVGRIEIRDGAGDIELNDVTGAEIIEDAGGEVTQQ